MKCRWHAPRYPRELRRRRTLARAPSKCEGSPTCTVPAEWIRLASSRSRRRLTQGCRPPRSINSQAKSWNTRKRLPSRSAAVNSCRCQGFDSGFERMRAPRGLPQAPGPLYSGSGREAGIHERRDRRRGGSRQDFNASDARGVVASERRCVMLRFARRDHEPCVGLAIRGRNLRAGMRQFPCHNRDLQQRKGTQHDRESNVTHGLVLPYLW